VIPLDGASPPLLVDLLLKLFDDEIIIGHIFGFGGEFLVERRDAFLFDSKRFGRAFVEIFIRTFIYGSHLLPSLNKGEKTYI
jgi:hypothetical protein